MLYETYSDGEKVPLYAIEYYYEERTNNEYNTRGYINGETIESSYTSVTYKANTIRAMYYKYKSWTDEDGVSRTATYNIYRHYLLTVENQDTASEKVTAITDLDNNVTWKFSGDFLP